MLRRKNTRLFVRQLEDRCVPATFVVHNTDDSGAGSLRQAILDANQLAGADEIIFDPAVFGSQQTITLTTGQLLIEDALVIHGVGASLLTISGNNSSRIFEVRTPLSVGIRGLTLTDGSADFGGAIYSMYNGGEIIIDSCHIVGNRAHVGGGIRTGFSLTVIDSVISGNTARGSGGGIYRFPSSSGITNSLTISGSTIADNVAHNGGGIEFAGQIGKANILSISNSTITGNRATAFGGGINISGPSLNVTIVETTLTGNTAGTLGGGIGFFNAYGAVLIKDSIISSNAAFSGGGIGSHSGNGTIGGTFDIVLENSNVSGNVNDESTPPSNPIEIPPPPADQGIIALFVDNEGTGTFDNFAFFALRQTFIEARAKFTFGDEPGEIERADFHLRFQEEI